MTLTRRRVVVTGLGVICPAGNDVASTWSALREGRSGIGRITAFEQNEEWTVTIAGEVRGWDVASIIDVKEARRMDRFCHLGIAAALEAAGDSGIDFTSGPSERRGVAIGSGIGGILTIEEGHTKLLATGPRKINPFTVPRLMVNACAGNVSIRLNLRGANICTATACATGSHAIGAAYMMIQRGDADVMLAGGSEAAVSPLCIGSFAVMKALSTRNDAPAEASRPFDRDRDGFVLSEGAAVIVLEAYEQARARGARIHAEVLGFGSSGDASHIAAPDEEGDGARRAMAAALHDARRPLDAVEYINAHGTSTPLGDAAEVRAVKQLFGAHATRLAMSSTKSMTGHALGAAGGIESVATILALRDGVLPPTINLAAPDDGFDLDFVPNTAREKRIAVAINNSFGFGGHNTSLVFGRFDG
ncbi:MAG TPA: beta-ketoacyl-ACP synthase II [Phycisphaerales bacterium]|nr:beta-ketoacyl-ACP synthase II [Phycisphaerales bacterium]HMP37347.1 beta-ketoacyl-ACP synthase II [Phycisphaerales bacterium]